MEILKRNKNIHKLVFCKTILILSNQSYQKIMSTNIARNDYEHQH